jgi:hypothetical protein
VTVLRRADYVLTKPELDTPGVDLAVVMMSSLETTEGPSSPRSAKSRAAWDMGCGFGAASVVIREGNGKRVTDEQGG